MTYTIPNAQMNKSVKDFAYQIFEQNTNLTVKDILTLMLEGVPLYLVKAYQAWRIKISAEDILKYLTFFSQKIGFDILCKLSPSEDYLHEMSKPIFWDREQKLTDTLYKMPMPIFSGKIWKE